MDMNSILITIATWCSINAGSGNVRFNVPEIAAAKTSCQQKLLTCWLTAQTKDTKVQCFLNAKLYE